MAIQITPPPILSDNDVPFVYQDWFRQVWLALKNRFLFGNIVFDFPNIGAVATATTTVTITGAAVGDNILVTPSTALEAGIVVYGYVSAANTITLVANNPTAGAINPASRTYYITVIKA